MSKHIRAAFLLSSVFFGLCRGMAERSLWQGAINEVNSGHEFRALCMDIWERIDLAQAINVSRVQKAAILEELAKSLLIVRNSTACLMQESFRGGAGLGPADAISLIEDLKTRLVATFADSDGEYYTISLRYLAESLALLYGDES